MSFGMGGIEVALGFGDLLVDLKRGAGGICRRLRGEGGGAGEAGVDAIVEAGFEAGVVAHRAEA